MSDSPSLLGGTFKSALSSFSTVFMLLLLILAARYLGAEQFGLFAFAMAFVFLFDFVLDPGLYHYLIRQIARDRTVAAKYLTHALLWKLIVAPFVILAMALILPALNSAATALTVVLLMGVASIVKSLKDAFRATFIAREAFGWEALSVTIERIALLVGGFTALALGSDVRALSWVFVIVRLVDLCVVTAIVRFRFRAPNAAIDWRFLWGMARSATPIAAFYVTLNLYNYLDKVMLWAMRNDIEVGWYSASYRIYEGLLIFPAIVATARMPQLSRLFHERDDGLANLLSQGLKYVTLISLLISVNGFMLARPITLVLFGAEYEPSIVAMRVLMAGVTFVFALNYLQAAMIAMDRQATILVLALIGLVANILANLIVIPKYGYIGAAAATVSVSGFLLLGFVMYMKRRVVNVDLRRLLLAPAALLGAVAFAVFEMLPVMPLAPRAIAVNLGFAVALLGTGIVSRAELAAVWRWLPFRGCARDISDRKPHETDP